MTSSAAIFDSVYQVLTFDLGTLIPESLRLRSHAAPSKRVSRPAAELLDEHEFRCRTDAWSDLSLYLPGSV